MVRSNCKALKLRSRLFVMLALFVAGLMWSTHAYAATITSNGTGGGTWATGLTWVGGVAPVSTDNAVIAGGDTVTLGADAQIVDLTILGTLDASTYTLTVGGNWTNSGTFTFGSSTVVFDGSSAQTITGVTVFSKITIASGASVRADSNISHRGLLTITGTLEIATGVQLNGTGAGPEINIEATGLLKGAGTYHTFIFDGKNPAIDGSVAIANYQYRAIWGTNTSIPIVSARYGIDSPDNVTTFATNVTVFAWGDCTIHTLIPTAGILQIDGDLTIAYSQALCSQSLTVDNSTNNATITVGGDLVIGDSGGTTPNTNTFITGDANVTVSGNVTIYASGSGGNIIDASGMSGKTLSVGGNWDSSGGTFTYGTSTVAIGTNGQSNTFTPNSSGASVFYNLTINAGSTISVSSYGFLIFGQATISGTFSIPSGLTVTARWANNLTINNSGILAGQGTYVRDVDATTTHIINNGTISIDTFRYRVRTWDVINNPQPITATTYGNDLEIVNLGSNDWTAYIGCSTEPACANLVVPGTFTMYHDRVGMVLAVNNSTYDIPITAGALVIGDSTKNGCANFNTGNITLTVNGSVTINQDLAPDDCANTIDSTDGTPIINVTGNWTNNDTFTAGSSTVTFDGAAAQSVTTGSSAFNAVVVTNASAGGVTFADALSTTDLTATTASTQLTFTAGQTYTITGASGLTLNGQAAGTEIQLRSTVTGTRYTLNVTGGAQTVSYVDVQDSNASGSDITANNSIDNGNNDNGSGTPQWVFGNVTRYWVGGAAGCGSNTWADTDCWSTASGGSGGADAPNTGDTAIFDGGDTTGCSLTANVSVAVIDLRSGYTGGSAKLDASGFDITTTSTLDITGGELELDAGSDLTVAGVLTVDGGLLDAVNGTIDANSSVSISAGTLTAPTGVGFTVAGNWSYSAGTFTPGAGTVTFDGLTSTTLDSGGASFNNLAINKTDAADANDNLTVQTSNLTPGGTLTITDGDLIQNNVNIQTGGLTTVTANGRWINNTDGDVTLAGNVSNAGTITFDATTAFPDGILIRSTPATTPRNWQGAGIFNMTDVDASYQTCNGGMPASILVISGTDSGNNNNWLFGQPTISSAANQTFQVGDPATAISAITITDDAVSPTITVANDIRIMIPNGFNMQWNTSDTTAAISGTASGKVNTNVAFATVNQANDTLVITVTGDFAVSENIVVSGLSFTNFTAASAAANLELDVYNSGTATATDDKTITISVAIASVIRDTDGDGTNEEARDPGGDGSYEVYFDPGGSVASTAVLSADGDGDGNIDHFIDTNGDGTPEWYWDPDDNIFGAITLDDATSDGINEWIFDADGNGSLDHAYNTVGAQFVDPFGIVFDSATNAPIQGAVVTIFNNATGLPAVSGVDIAAADTNPVTTGVTGAYAFNALAGQNFFITVSAAGFTFPYTPATRIFNAAWGRSICTANPPTYPSAGCLGVNGSRGEVFLQGALVTNKDFPLDGGAGLLRLTKEANKKEASVGDIITYTLSIENKTASAVTGVYIADRTPPGFKYVTDRAILDGQKISNPEGQRPITFAIGTVEAGQTRTLKYQLIIGSGVSFGEYENSAWARYEDGTVISNIAREEVTVIPDPLFDLGTVIGKVFWDSDEDGVQGSGDIIQGIGTEEESGTGLGNIEIVTEEGTVITTDKDGKYHLAGIVPGRHIMRLNERTLPSGVYLTTDKAVIIDITPGILQKVNFGANKGQGTEHKTQNTEHKIQDTSHSTQNTETMRAISPGGQQDSLPATDSQGSSPAEGQSTGGSLQSKDNDFMFVLLGDVKAGHTSVSGNIEPAGNDDTYKKGFWSEGKLAYYLKGKIKGKYIITSSLDTDREKKELFRDLDPDKYYPVYGDASTVNYDATDTQGMLFLAVEWDKSKAMWGNYKTGITDTELAHYNRTLYGGKLHYETVSVTEAGKPQTKLIIFQAQAQQKAARNEFLGTGGSLYYLKHKPIVEGSDKISIEVRDKVTNLVTGELGQIKGEDYEIDYSDGRILFYRPVTQIAESYSIISSALLDGDSLYVVVDYEYEVNEAEFSEWSYGGRAEQSLMPLISIFQPEQIGTNSKFLKDIRLGGTYIRDDKDTGLSKLEGIDGAVYLGDYTVITGEYARSKGQGVESFVSTDGGLNFTEVVVSNSEEGEAYSIKAKTELVGRIALGGYYKKVEKGFSDSSSVSEQGKESAGGEIGVDITEKTHLKIRHDTEKLLDGGTKVTGTEVGAQRTDTTTAQITHDMGRLKLTGEFRHIDIKEKIEEDESESEEGDTAALRADYEINKDLGVFLEQQATLSGEKNHQTTGGASVKDLFGWLDIKVSETIGTEGDATSISATARVDSRTEIYNTYTMSNLRADGKKTSIVAGSKRELTDKMDLTAESQTSTSIAETSSTNIFGLSGELNDRWRLSGSFERGKVHDYSGDISERNAGSIGISYVEKNRIKASSKIDLRFDNGEENERQYLFYNAVQWQADRDTTLFGKIELSESRNTTLDATDAEYKKIVFGGAYRPVNFDRLNLLAKYTYLEDETASDQIDMSDIEAERSHVFAVEGVYDLTEKWQLVEKIAFKLADEKVSGFDFTGSETWLWINRVNHNLYRKWQIGVEYRILRVKLADDMKQGALIEVARYIGKNLQVGVGYNFTDFNDDITYLDYTSQGPFIRLSVKFTD